MIVKWPLSCPIPKQSLPNPMAETSWARQKGIVSSASRNVHVSSQSLQFWKKSNFTMKDFWPGCLLQKNVTTNIIIKMCIEGYLVAYSHYSPLKQMYRFFFHQSHLSQVFFRFASVSNSRAKGALRNRTSTSGENPWKRPGMLKWWSQVARADFNKKSCDFGWGKNCKLKRCSLEGIYFRIEWFSNFSANKADVSEVTSMNQSALCFFQKSFLMNLDWAAMEWYSKDSESSVVAA